MDSDNKFDFDNQVVNNIEKLKRYARSFGLNECDAEDLTYNTILKAYENKDKYQVIEGHDFCGWLFRVQRNLFFNQYRRDSAHSVDLYDNDMITMLDEQKAYSKETDSDTMYTESFDLIKGLLSDTDFKVIMAFANGYHYFQISEILDVPIGTVKSKIFNIRQRLIEHMNGIDYKKGKRS